MIDATEVLNHLYAAMTLCLSAPSKQPVDRVFRLASVTAPSLMSLATAIGALHDRAELELAAFNLATCEQVCQRCAAAPADTLWEPDDVAGIEVCEPCAERLQYERERAIQHDRY